MFRRPLPRRRRHLRILLLLINVIQVAACGFACILVSFSARTPPTEGLHLTRSTLRAMQSAMMKEWQQLVCQDGKAGESVLATICNAVKQQPTNDQHCAVAWES